MKIQEINIKFENNFYEISNFFIKFLLTIYFKNLKSFSFFKKKEMYIFQI
jgi:hypothetical protein